MVEHIDNYYGIEAITVSWPGHKITRTYDLSQAEQTKMNNDIAHYGPEYTMEFIDRKA